MGKEMREKIYLRIAKGKRHPKVSASLKPNSESLYADANKYKPIPTVQIALVLDIPDSEFEASRILLQAAIENSMPAVKIKQVQVEEER